MEQSNYQHDIFISHASEDKDDFVRPLAEKLQQKHYRIWYDEFSLTLGDSLSSSIDKGLKESRFGLIVISPKFIEKPWPQRELQGLVQKELQYGKVILPIWHKVTYKQVSDFSLTLADKLAAKSSEGLENVTNQIVQALKKAGVVALSERGIDYNRYNILRDLLEAKNWQEADKETYGVMIRDTPTTANTRDFVVEAFG
ncbi:MAG: TIR domain-containing protein [Nostoc sp.]|uniref:TIR domain-containing protein n=1 Tax=Nostoc sp. TaxID=1180 RepID=UPI002FFD2505